MSSGTATPSGRYVFINKRTEDVGKKDSDEDFVIRSHVHGEHRRQQRHARNKALKLSSLYGRRWPQRSGTLTAVTRPALPTETYLRSPGRQSSGPKQSTGKFNWRPGAAPVPRGQSLVDTDPIDEETGSRQQLPKAIPATTLALAKTSRARPPNANYPPGPLSHLGSGSSDPFSAAAVPITALHHGLIEFWEHRFLRAVCPSGENPGWMKTTQALWLDEIRGALSTPARIHGLFAAALLFMQHTMMGPSREKRKIASTAIEHKVACLSSLRDAMVQPNLKVVLKAMYIAATMHFIAGEIFECNLHAKAIAALVKQIGGVGRLDQILILQLFILDTNLAYVLLQRPRLPTSDWEPAPWPEQPFAGRAHSLLATPDFASAQDDDNDVCVSLDDPYHLDVPASLQTYLQSHREVVYARHLAQQLERMSHGTSGPVVRTATKLSEDIQLWTRMRRFALSSQCMSLYFDIPERHSAQRDFSTLTMVEFDLHQSMCLAAEYCKRIIFRENWEQVYVDIQFVHLRRSLTRVLDGIRDAGELQHGEALFFSFFVGAAGEELMLVDPPGAATDGLSTRWFSRHMAVLAIRLGVFEVEKTKALLRQFLYDACALDLPLKALIAQRDVLLQDPPPLP